MSKNSALLVEDHADIRKVIATVLADEGFEVIQARHGLDALERVAQGARPDVIVLDLMTPVMDGWGFIVTIGEFESLASIPIVALSAIRPPREVLEKVAAVLSKPFDAGELARVLRSVVGAHA